MCSMSGSTRASSTTEAVGVPDAGLGRCEATLPEAHARGSALGLRRRLGLIAGILLVGIWILGAIGAPLAPYGADEQRLLEAFQPPSARHLFGTDDLGRDVLTRVLYGGRYTLSLALAVVLLAGSLGMLVGVLAGYFGGWVDEALMRATEVVMAFPAIILAMAIVVALGPGLLNAGLAMVLVWWPPYARLARGEALAVRRQEYVEAAVAWVSTTQVSCGTPSSRTSSRIWSSWPRLTWVPR